MDYDIHESPIVHLWRVLFKRIGFVDQNNGLTSWYHWNENGLSKSQKDCRGTVTMIPTTKHHGWFHETITKMLTRKRKRIRYWLNGIYAFFFFFGLRSSQFICEPLHACLLFDFLKNAELRLSVVIFLPVFANGIIDAWRMKRIELHSVIWWQIYRIIIESSANEKEIGIAWWWWRQFILRSGACLFCLFLLS